jgi:hypothetical protein
MAPLLLLLSPLLLFVAAYVQWATVGRPALPQSPTLLPGATAEPHGFPPWLRVTHYVIYLGLVGVAVVAGHKWARLLGSVEAPAHRAARCQGDHHPGDAALPRPPGPAGRVPPGNISPFCWANGKLPTCEEWKTLAASGFKQYRLKVHGLVEEPAELSLSDLRAHRELQRRDGLKSPSRS